MNELNLKAILLDIEGTTSSVAFVYDVMFPYVRQHVCAFLEHESHRADVQAAIDQMAVDDGFANARAWSRDRGVENEPTDRPTLNFLTNHVLSLMDGDSKSTGLKALQGLIWQAGFESGELKAHLFPDVVPAIEGWHRQGIAIGIYSSGSVVAQKLFFGHTPHGDLTRFFKRHYDTTIGPKRDSASYARIALDFGFSPHDILFLSDIAAELEAATSAGLQAIAVVRPGNAPLPETYCGSRIDSFSDLPFVSHPPVLLPDDGKVGARL